MTEEQYNQLAGLTENRDYEVIAHNTMMIEKPIGTAAEFIKKGDVIFINKSDGLIYRINNNKKEIESPMITLKIKTVFPASHNNVGNPTIHFLNEHDRVVQEIWINEKQIVVKNPDLRNFVLIERDILFYTDVLKQCLVYIKYDNPMEQDFHVPFKEIMEKYYGKI